MATARVLRLPLVNPREAEGGRSRHLRVVRPSRGGLRLSPPLPLRPALATTLSLPVTKLAIATPAGPLPAPAAAGWSTRCSRRSHGSGG